MTNRTCQSRGAFTLIELLVVVAIIALLIAILLPSLHAAREQTKQTVCGTNLRAVGQGLATYTTEQNSYPHSYIYDPMTLTANQQAPDFASNGYLHWSWNIYNLKHSNSGQNLATNAKDMGSLEKAFQCPSLNKGGVPPTNPGPDNLDEGQTPETPGVVDRQARRLAYTANEALIPKNKFVAGFQGAIRRYRYVKPDGIRSSGGTILATEFIPDWKVVSGGSNTDGQTVCKSHRPVHGFRGVNGELDAEDIPLGVNPAPLTRVVATDIDTNPQVGAASQTRLDWLGRNHGRRSSRTTNFLYADTHVENKKIEKTVPSLVNGQIRGKGEWGQQFYSLERGEVFLPGQGPND